MDWLFVSASDDSSIIITTTRSPSNHQLWLPVHLYYHDANESPSSTFDFHFSPRDILFEFCQLVHSCLPPAGLSRPTLTD